MKKIKVGILGYGTVGSGTHEILIRNHDLIQKRTGVSVEVVRILRRKSSDSHLFTDDPDVILNDPDIDLIVEEKDKKVIISVKDYGTGLPKEVQEKLFKEMVTTKGKTVQV